MKFIKNNLRSIFLVLKMVVMLQLVDASKKPNVIIVLTDDQGYGDLQCHGNPIIKTPNIDALHSQSVRFTNFHVDPTCAPTRGALLSGKYAHRAGVWHTICGGNHLRASETTMANIFNDNGYRTALFGKWHLGSNYPYRPMDRGFDEWLGHGDGGTGTTDDWFYNDRVNDHYWHNGERIQKEGFATDVFFDAAIDFVNDSDEDPFFIYLATYLPHDPHTLPDSTWANKYNSVVSNYVSYFYMGIDRIDQNIGRLRESLKKSGKDENTIFIFMSDNGGTAGVKVYNANMRGKKTQVYDGGHRVPFYIHWPDGKFKQAHDVDDLSAHIDVLPTMIDLCNLNLKENIEFDGRSFKKQLYQPNLKLKERTLFVENQRTFIANPWEQTAGMTNRWRLVNNTELYDMYEDPSQKNNVIDERPEVVQQIREAHKKYWAHVTPNDRERPLHIIGNPKDKESFLQCSDWYLPSVPWNHTQVAKGMELSGDWDISVEQDGIYRFELRRWPREANAPINGVPLFNKKVDAWNYKGGVTGLIYPGKVRALPVHKIKLEVQDYSESKLINNADSNITFELKLKKGNTKVKGSMLDDVGQVIAGVYYIYVTKED